MLGPYVVQIWSRKTPKETLVLRRVAEVEFEEPFPSDPVVNCDAERLSPTQGNYASDFRFGSFHKFRTRQVGVVS